MDQADVDGTYMCVANPDRTLDETNTTSDMNHDGDDNADTSTSSSGTLNSQSSPVSSTSSHELTAQPIDETQSIEVLKKNMPHIKNSGNKIN